MRENKVTDLDFMPKALPGSSSTVTEQKEAGSVLPSYAIRMLVVLC